MHPSLRLASILPAFLCAAFAAEVERWRIDPTAGISTDAATLFAGGGSHADHVAMGGRAVDVIVEWKWSGTGAPQITRRVRFPLLRGVRDDTHSSLTHVFTSADVPVPTVDGAPWPAETAVGAAIREGLSFTSRAGGLEVRRTEFPSTGSPVFFERWEIRNAGTRPVQVAIPRHVAETRLAPSKGKWAGHIFRTEWTGSGERRLAPGESMTAGVIFSGREDAVGAVPADAPPVPDIGAEYAARRALADRLDAELVLVTPDPAVNRMFAMAKLRSVESVAATRGGLMQGPGGYNNFNAAIWCNDNAEYMAPYHAYLGDPAGMESSRNTYALFAKFMNPRFRPIPSSIIAEGRSVWAGAGDRGDAAMCAQGATRFLLASGDRELAKELWPFVAWCLDYCDTKRTPEGVIASDRDELEGRFSSGKTNLATSALTYDALVSAAMLARELGLPEETSAGYARRAAALRSAIETYFGARVQGFETYRYHEGLENLRAWICLPLAFGILDRAPGTLDALYSPELWTSDGLRTDAKDRTFWDRSTLFALRATFIAGDVARGAGHLTAYTRRRLLGDHVPYAVEAYPEAGKSHLSGESCLYARIFIEGVLGIRPTGFRRFEITPHLPKQWPGVTLANMHAYGAVRTLRVTRTVAGVRVLVTDAAGGVVHDSTAPEGTSRTVDLSDAAR